MDDRKSVNIEIGQRIRASREQAGLTQEQLSKKLNLSKMFLSTVERGNSGVSVETLINLCNILNVSSDWLLFEKGGTPTAQSIAQRLSGLSDEQLAIIDRMIAEFVALLKV